MYVKVCCLFARVWIYSYLCIRVDMYVYILMYVRVYFRVEVKYVSVCVYE